VTSARLREVSVTSDPINRHCRILEKRARDPLIALWRNQVQRWDLVKRQVELLGQYVEAIPAALAAAAPPPKPPTPARN
jgi:hypothetical protein